MRHEDSALRRSWLTANTAREGRPSEEQADLTETHTPLASSSRWNTVPFTFCTLRFKICGTAVSGLLMRTLGYWASPVRRRAFRARMCSTRAGSPLTAFSSASASEQASATVGVPLR